MKPSSIVVMLAVAASALAPASAAAAPPTTVRVSVNSAGVQGNGGSSYPVISADQRFVAFQSSATNLVNGDTNASYDVSVRDRKLHKTVRVSVNSAGFQGNGGSYSPVISSDGRFATGNCARRSA
jgi:opacity protein-like surface antigen